MYNIGDRFRRVNRERGCWWRDSNPQGLSPSDVTGHCVCQFRHTSHLVGCEPRQSRRPRRKTSHVLPPAAASWGPGIEWRASNECRWDHIDAGGRSFTPAALRMIGSRAPRFLPSIPARSCHPERARGTRASEGSARDAAVDSHDPPRINSNPASDMAPKCSPSASTPATTATNGFT